MHRGLASFCGTSLLVASCGGDEPGTTPGDSGSESEEGSTADDASSLDPDDSGESSGNPTDDGATSEVDTSTGADETCGNDMIDGTERCDGIDLGGADCITQGFDTGTLACAADCMAFDTSACGMTNCGDGSVGGKENCDGTDLGGATCASAGFENGTLACAANCVFDTSGCGLCGNGTTDGDEVCDSSLGGQSCVGLGFDSGSLDCAADCLGYDTSGCGTCGNAVIDGTEFCDTTNLAGMSCGGFGYDSGTLACAANCTAFDFSVCGNCGNDVTDGDEFCDGTSNGGETCVSLGFDSGTLDCTADCASFVTDGCGTCGDGILDAEETCDSALLGGETCASLGLSGGELACSDVCEYDISGCDVAGFLFGSDVGYNGYSFEPPTLPCDDISATGTATLLSDDSQLEVPIGFTFPFYDVDFTNVTIESNGALHFGSAEYLTLANECLPSATAPSANNLYVFWDDLNPGAAGDVYYQTLGTPGDYRLVVQWDTAHYSGDLVDLIRFQAMLLESTGQIILCYPDTLSAGNFGDNGAEATSGIQRDSATGFEFSCNTPDLVNGLEVFYVPL